MKVKLRNPDRVVEVSGPATVAFCKTKDLALTRKEKGIEAPRVRKRLR